MTRRTTLLLWIVCVLILPSLLRAEDSLPAGAPESLSADDWPWWRGLHRNGHAPADQDPPLQWSQSENIVWKTPIAGRGYGSPIVVGDAIYLATADEEAETRSLVCIDRASGKQQWECVVHKGSPTPPKNKKGTQASSTPACDGERLFINFLHDGGMVTSAVSLEGDLLWQQRITDYVVHQGYGSSPAVFGPLVIVSADNKSGGAIAGLDRKSGDIVWKQNRPKTPNYPSPIILEVAGRRQVLMTGCDLVASFDPLSGERLWQFDGATTECVTSTVTDGERIYSSGGYPRNHVAAIAADGTGEVAWENSTRVYVPSMLVKEGHLYAVADAGFAVCWKSDTGKELWKGRLGGTFSSSPVLVGDRVYITNEAGESFVFRATPEKFELLGKSDLGDECFATPAIVGGRIYTRIADISGDGRQEFLYCIGK